MGFRVFQTILLLCGVLVLVYWALFRSIEIETGLYHSHDPFATSRVTNTHLDDGRGFHFEKKDPLRDAPLDVDHRGVDTRVQVIASGAQQIVTYDAMITPQPIMIDGLKFHATQDLFDGNNTDTSATFVGKSSLPGMFIRQGQQKILSQLGLSSYAKIIYKDIHNTHFILLSSFDFHQWKTAVQKLGGSLLVISSQIDRNNRGLFGDNVYQVMLPKYRHTKMIRLINTRNEWRYVQMDKDRYESGGKEFIKNTLPQYYYN